MRSHSTATVLKTLSDEDLRLANEDCYNEIDNQNADLDELHDILLRLKKIAVAIGNQLDTQHDLIDTLDMHVDETNLTLQQTTKDVNKLEQKVKGPSCNIL